MQSGDRLEELVLSGELFNGPSRSSSPSRSPSPDSTPSRPWPTEDISDAAIDSAYSPNITTTANTDVHDPNSSVGMGPGRTGVKGVIRDRDEAVALSRAQRASEISALNRAMERASLGGKTFLEEEADKLKEKKENGAWEKEALEGGSLFAMGMGSGMVGKMMGGVKRGRFGHLREVGEKGYVNAVEGERGDVWVVVHIYDPVSFCASLYALDMTVGRGGMAIEGLSHWAVMDGRTFLWNDMGHIEGLAFLIGGASSSAVVCHISRFIQLHTGLPITPAHHPTIYVLHTSMLIHL